MDLKILKLVFLTSRESTCLTYVKSLAFWFYVLAIPFSYAQGELRPIEGFTPQIGSMVFMLEDLKDRITEEVKDLNQSQTDFLYDDDANSIGALVMHLVSTEVYYQLGTLEGIEWTEEGLSTLEIAAELNPNVKEMLRGKPIDYYLDLWTKVREKSLAGLKTKDDEWFASNIEEGINYHYIWYHVMEHSANHMGQIATIKNRLPK